MVSDNGWQPPGFLLGVLGGMGPLATVDFLHKLVAATPAVTDQQQIPFVAWNVPQIPDRQQALAGTGISPLPALQHGVQTLLAAGATHIAMPCNTAHYWYAQLANSSSHAHFLHIIDASVAQLQQRFPDARRIGLVATGATLHTGLYQRQLAQQGFEVLHNDETELAKWFTPGCYAVKRHALDEGAQLLAQASEALVARGADVLLLACTEVPVALQHARSALLATSIDTTAALADACVAEWLAWRSPTERPPDSH